MSPQYIIRKIEQFEAKAILEFHSTPCDKRRHHLNCRLDTACYLKIMLALKTNSQNISVQQTHRQQ